MYPTGEDPFRKWLSQQREAGGYSRDVVADLAAISPQTLAQIERGEAPTNSGIRARLAAAIDTLNTRRRHGGAA